MASGRRGRQQQQHSSSTSSSSSLSPPSSPAIALRDMGRPRVRERAEEARTHAVERGDTLPGLALRYGVTTEQIRRANHLFANESLFLRKTLLIPVPGSPDRSDNGNRSGRSTKPGSLDNGREDTDTASHATSANTAGTSNENSSSSSGKVGAVRENGRLDAAPSDEVTASDFFSRIDALFERTRANLSHGCPAACDNTATPPGGKARPSPGSARSADGGGGGDSTGLLEMDDELIFSDDHFGRLDFHSQQQQRAQHEPMV